jgi:vacuolar-type H+-ATPase subunit E/Vma4
MGFEELASELHKSAESEAKKIVNAAEKNAGRIVDEAKLKGEESVKTAKKEASEFAKQESSERITSAKLAAKKMVDESRDEAVEAAIHQVWQKYKSDSLKKSAYPALLSRLVRQGMEEIGQGASVVLYVRDEDRSLVAGHKTKTLPSEYSGGVIVETADGKVQVNRTLEEVFAQKKQALRKQIYDKLF